MSDKTIISDKFKDMDYEKAVNKLKELISVLEKGEGKFDDLIEVYKEAFEYYTYCSEYLVTAADKVKELNIAMAEITARREAKI